MREAYFETLNDFPNQLRVATNPHAAAGKRKKSSPETRVQPEL
jgi:hypothetical protein